MQNNGELGVKSWGFNQSHLIVPHETSSFIVAKTC